MTVYYIVFFLTLILSYYIPAKTDKQFGWKLFWTFLPLFIFGALRVDFGNDYAAYEMYFDKFHTSSFVYDEKEHAEIGYQFLCYIMPSFRSILVLNSLLLCLSLSVFIYRNVPPKYIWLAVILIFLNAEKNIYGSLVGIRNGLVVSMFLLAFVFVQQRKLLLFAGITLLAITIHKSSLFFLPVAYFVGQNKRIYKGEIIFWLAASIVVLLSSLSDLSSIVEKYLVGDYEAYIAYLEKAEHRGWLFVSAGLALFILSFYILVKFNKTFNKAENSLLRLGLLFTFTTLLGSMAMRSSYFYDMFFIGTVTTLFAMTKKKTLSQYVLLGLTIAVSLYSFIVWRTNNLGNEYYDVYHSILDDMFTNSQPSF